MAAGKDMKIRVNRNGPYEISGGVPLREELVICDAGGTPLRWQPGKSYPEQESYKLCRCGKTGTMPFCDSTHEKVGFRDAERSEERSFFEQADLIEGPGVKLYDVMPFCVRAGFCHRGGSVWKLAATSSDPEAVRIVIDDACDCRREGCWPRRR